MKCYASFLNSWSAWIPPALASGGGARTHAVVSHADNDVGALRAAGVQAFASSSLGGIDRQPEHLVNRALREDGYPHVLIAFPFDRDHRFATETLGYEPENWLGDSGAFSLWTTGEEVDLGELITWATWHVERDPGFRCISLDVIPGDPRSNAPPTAKERRRCQDASLENGDAMRTAGLKISEVFHVFEPVEFLDVLLERRQPGEVLGIGGLVGRAASLKRQFCDAVFARLKDYSGGWSELVPAHGLGLAPSSELGSRYPWYSIDSSSWVAPSKYGRKPPSRYGRGGGPDSRTSHSSIRHLYLARVLRGWLERERALSRLWALRGVSFRA